jgi:serine/threonine-protein kinase
MDFAHVAAGVEIGGRYRIERAIKAGGMGAVYEAVHTATKKKVALKLMHPSIVANPDMRRRFAQEATVSALVGSRHLVDVLDAGVDDAAGGVPFLVMELLHGQELGDRIRVSGPVAVGEALDFLDQVAEGLAKAHQAGIVHRDLKPENLFVAKDEHGSTVKILDFGIAKVVEGAVSAPTQSGGTPLYMAPEQMGRDGVTTAVDIWAFGLVAFTMLVGQPYWSATSIGQLYGDILGGDYPSAVTRARELGATLPPSFDAFFFRCVARDPSARFPTALEAAQALRHALGSAGPVVVRSLPAPAPISGDAPTQLASASQPTPIAPSALAASVSTSHLTPPGIAAPGTSPPSAGSPGSASAAPPTSSSSSPHTGRTAPSPPGVESPPPSSALTALAPVAAVSASPRRGLLVGLVAGVLGVVALGAFFSFRSMRARRLIETARSAEAMSSARAGTGGRSGAVAKPRRVTRLAAGEDHTCALFADGGAMCWGQASPKVNAGPPLEVRARPKALPGLTGATYLSAGGYSTCAVTSAAKISCFGSIVSSSDRPSPAELTDVDVVSVGHFRNLCAVMHDGRLDCFGDYDIPRESDHSVRGVSGVRQVALGYEHACALLAGGDVACFGENADHQLGDGTITKHTEVRHVDGVSDVVELAAGHAHTCGRRADGTVVCWGDPSGGALGRASSDGKPAPVPGVERTKGVAAGLHSTCVIEHDGGVRCWGQVRGRPPEAGDPSAPKSPPGFRVPGLSDVKELVMGPRHACALLGSGRVVCWGDDESGQLGFVAADACADGVPCAHEPIVVAGLTIP